MLNEGLVNKELSGHFRKDHSDLSVHVWWYHTKLLPCKMARIFTNWSAHRDVCRKVLAQASVRMHLVKVYVMPHHNVTLQN